MLALSPGLQRPSLAAQARRAGPPARQGSLTFWAAREASSRRSTRVYSSPDKRSSSQEHGKLSAGEKSAITREVHGEGHVHFTEEHPELKKAAAAYAKEVKQDEKQGKLHGHGHSGGTTAAQEQEPPPRPRTVELTQGEKAAVSRAVHTGHDLRRVPFVKACNDKIAAAKQWAEVVKEKGKKK